jgi:hypothetical protein
MTEQPREANIGYDLPEFCEVITDTNGHVCGYDFDDIIKDITVSSKLKLSNLQHQILLLALRNRQSPIPHRGGRLYHAEILHECFGWAIDSGLRNLKSIREMCGYAFSECGKGKGYNAAHASVSRSVRRLEQRSLVIRLNGYSRWAAVELTDLGVKVAESLLPSKSS